MLKNVIEFGILRLADTGWFRIVYVDLSVPDTRRTMRDTGKHRINRHSFVKLSKIFLSLLYEM